MAKKSNSANASRGRVLSNSTRTLTPLPRVVHLSPIPQRTIQNDRRLYNPTRSSARVGATVASSAQIVDRSAYNSKIWSIGFRIPADVSICKRRKARRSVLHALGVAGRKGIGRGKNRKTNFWSKVKC